MTRPRPARRLLGAVLAGGLSTRFGRDKALALHEGAPLLAHAVATLTRRCDAVVVIGRAQLPDGCPPVACLPDWPAPGMGPLAGVAAALRHAAARGYDSVLTVPVDALHLPVGLLAELSPAPAYLASQPVIGLWRASAAPAAEAILAAPTRHSMRALAQALEARPVALAQALPNLNTPADLAALPFLESSMTDTPRAAALAVLERYYAAFNAGDAEGMLACLTEDVAHDINQGARQQGKEAFRAFLAHMDRCYRERLTDIVLMAHEDGTRAAAEFVVHGQYLATDEGLPEASGQSYVLPAAGVFTLRDGQIARVGVYYNLADWTRQVEG